MATGWGGRPGRLHVKGGILEHQNVTLYCAPESYKTSVKVTKIAFPTTASFRADPRANSLYRVRHTATPHNGILATPLLIIIFSSAHAQNCRLLKAAQENRIDSSSRVRRRRMIWLRSIMISLCQEKRRKDTFFNT